MPGPYASEPSLKANGHDIPSTIGVAQIARSSEVVTAVNGCKMVMSSHLSRYIIIHLCKLKLVVKRDGTVPGHSHE
jgi:hypothetical protein